MSRFKIIDCEFFVGGAGYAGICAAIQAARLGLKTVLVEKEMLLGGNGGPNLGVGAFASLHYNPYWNETGIVEEIEERVSYNKAKIMPAYHGLFNISPLWDHVVTEMLEKEGVTILRKHLIHEVEVENSTIKSIQLINIENLDHIQVEVKGFAADCTGDGIIAELSGAAYRMGRESKSETGERNAPETADRQVSASSVTAVVVETGIDSPFVPPEGTPKWNPKKPVNAFNPKDKVNFLYTVDEGGESDENHPVYTPQELYMKLVKRIFSIWDFIKNVRNPEETKNFQLIWLSPILGRRESRRIEGDYLLTQTDIESGRIFEDAVGFAGNSMDEHLPSMDGGYEVHFHNRPLPYDIPFRCLYSKNINNLFSGGRAIGVTHMAFTAIRLMRTGGQLGQVVAIAARLCKDKAITPRELGREYIKELQQQIIKNDGFIPGVKGNDEKNIAAGAKVTASSEAVLSRQNVDGLWKNAVNGAGAVIYNYPEKIETVRVYVSNPSDKNIELVLKAGYGETSPMVEMPIEKELQGSGFYHHYKRSNEIQEFKIVFSGNKIIPAGFKGWVEYPVVIKEVFPNYSRSVFLQGVLLEFQGELDVLTAPHQVDVIDGVTVENGRYKYNQDVPVFELTPDPVPGKAQNLLDGYIQREGMGVPHQWISQPGLPMPQWVEYDFQGELEFNRLQLRFDITERYWEDMHTVKGEKAAGRCVSDFRLEALIQGEWKVIYQEKGNYLRFKDITLPEHVRANKLKLVVEKMWGENEPARVYEVRVYCE